jgi:hypothetical protein
MQTDCCELSQRHYESGGMAGSMAGPMAGGSVGRAEFAEMQNQQAAAFIQQRMKEADELRREEQTPKVQATLAKLVELGPCPRNFACTKVRGGYNCAGGSHWITDKQAELLMQGVSWKKIRKMKLRPDGKDLKNQHRRRGALRPPGFPWYN